MCMISGREAKEREELAFTALLHGSGYTGCADGSKTVATGSRHRERLQGAGGLQVPPLCLRAASCPCTVHLLPSPPRLPFFLYPLFLLFLLPFILPPENAGRREKAACHPLGMSCCCCPSIISMVGFSPGKGRALLRRWRQSR